MNKHTTIVVALIVVLAIALVAVGYLAAALNETKNQAEQTQQALLAEQQAQAAQQEKSLEDKLQITWPTRGSSLCYENQYSVSWQAPTDMDAVTVTLSSLSTSTKIGDYPAVTGTSGDLGYSSFMWDLTDSTGAVVPPSQVYKLTIAGMYHGHEISTSTDGVFSVGKCQ